MSAKAKKKMLNRPKKEASNQAKRRKRCGPVAVSGREKTKSGHHVAHHVVHHVRASSSNGINDVVKDKENDKSKKRTS